LLPFLDVKHPRLLEDVAAVPRERFGEWEQILARVELRLIVEAQRARDGEWEGRLLDV
jgi:hypothetical protein